MDTQNKDEIKDYKEAYEKERAKAAFLLERVASLEDQVDDLQFKLDRIHNNGLWKVSKPAREVYHFVRRQADRIRNQGDARGVIKKVQYKIREKQAVKGYGTASFPDKEERARQEKESAAFQNRVLFSILVPLYNTPEEYLRDMLDSVLNQTYDNWQLCLADGSDDAHAYVGKVVAEYRSRSENLAKRIAYKKLDKNGGISYNTNQCLELAKGEYIAPFDHDDYLHPSVLYEYAKVINEQGADYLYCDETTFRESNLNHFVTIHFKPDYAIDNLRANNYICHLSCFDRKLLEGEELYRSEFDGSQDHDMILRLTDKARKIVHVPKLLYYWRSHAGSTAGNIAAKTYAIDAAKGAVADHLRRHGFANFKITSTRAFETIFKITYEIQGDPLVSIVIANRDHAQDLKRCLTSIFEKSTYENYEIIIVENGSTEEETKRYYKEVTSGPYKDRVSVVEYKYAEGEAFNYSRINNFGVSKARGEYILLLNNDTEVISLNWIEELLMYAQRENMSAVTGACLMVKKRIYDELGGLDETFEVSLNDVDFCLRCRQKNYLNVFTPFAELYHYESLSRGSDVEDPHSENAKRYDREAEHFRTRWKEVIERGDPYYNPNFTLDRSDFSLKVQD